MKCIDASTSLFVATAAAAAVLLSACGSSEPAAAPASSAASSTQAVSVEPSTSSVLSSSSVSPTSAVEEQAGPTATSSTSSVPTDTSSVESSAPGTESTISGSGGVIKAGAATNLPAEVGTWTKADGGGDYPAYTSGDSTITLSFLAGSDYDGISSNVTNSRTNVGSGVCGSTSDATNLTCYLETADGVINASADAGDTPLVALVDFADQLTTTLGTS